jgi:hypothetical protein
MTQADSVLSTPPTNTSANKSQSSRRRFLVHAAGVAAGGAALGAGLPLPAPAATPDPIYAGEISDKNVDAFDQSSPIFENMATAARAIVGGQS